MDFYKLVKTLDTLSESKPTKEGSMASAAHHKSGPKFGGYWKGTQKSPPKPGQGVGGCEESVEEQNMGPGTGGMEESVEEQIAREWKHFNEYGAVDQGGTGSSGKANSGNGYYTYDIVTSHPDNDKDHNEEPVTEQGANNPPQGAGPGTSQVDQQQTAKELQTAQNNINKLKTAGVNIPVSPSQAAQSAVKTVNDPKANAATGMNMDQASKKTAGGLGQEFEKTIAKANPGQVSQIANVIKQVKTGQQ